MIEKLEGECKIAVYRPGEKQSKNKCLWKERPKGGKTYPALFLAWNKKKLDPVEAKKQLGGILRSACV